MIKENMDLWDVWAWRVNAHSKGQTFCSTLSLLSPLYPFSLVHHGKHHGGREWTWEQNGPEFSNPSSPSISCVKLGQLDCLSLSVLICMAGGSRLP